MQGWHELQEKDVLSVGELEFFFTYYEYFFKLGFYEDIEIARDMVIKGGPREKTEGEGEGEREAEEQ